MRMTSLADESGYDDINACLVLKKNTTTARAVGVGEIKRQRLWLAVKRLNRRTDDAHQNRTTAPVASARPLTSALQIGIDHQFD